MSPTDQMVKTKVLIIEDEALVARELQIRLTKLDYNVVGVAASAVEAINLSSEHEPDLLLADIHIKGDMDGIEATRRIRDTRDVPVVFLTAYSDAETVARAKEVTPYGYIIKPVENRELEVAIEIALYKSRVERELKETRELLAMALQCVGDALLFMDINGTVTQISHEMQDLLKVSLPDIKGKPWHDAMGITEGSGVSQLVTQAITSRSLVRLSPFVLTDSAKNQYLVDGVVGPRDKGMVVILRCVTEINDEIQALTGPSSELPAFVPGTASFVQLVISIADVERKTLPAEVVGEILDEVENTVNQTLRSTDLASRYGKHLLVASLPYTALSEGEAIAGSLLKALQSRNYLAGRQSCRFSIGLAHGVQGDADPFELLRRATLAMDIARESGDERVHTWRPDPERHNDIFRSGDDTGSNYRHIVLLWNVMNALGREMSASDRLQAISAHMQRSLGLVSVSVWHQQKGRPALLAFAPSQSESESKLIETYGEMVNRLFLPVEEDQQHTENVSLYRVGTHAYCYVLVMSGTDKLATEDFTFLESLVDYLSSGFEAMAEGDAGDFDADWVTQDSQNFIYESESMVEVVENIAMVAPTDATVLVTGESGTGKELVASLIHATSSRKDRPFVIVDCSTVVDTLIESELFGHMKGAFTGAVSDFKGRLREAEGGTVFLDEVGELPLEVQSRLLRFVQDKKVLSVGGKQYDQVDTRVIAATNRNLQQMITDGQFREDLYYRLNVFSIQLPPLRGRAPDIPIISRFYLRRFANQYKKAVEDFTPEALHLLSVYSWPGNVRELSNTINRAVILCRDNMITPIHLGLLANENEFSGETLLAGDNARTRLREKLAQCIATCMDANEFPPLGSWLEDDLIIAMLDAQEGVSSKAAAYLNLPETTLRRKILKIKAGSGASGRPGYWQAIAGLLPDYIDFASSKNLSVLEDGQKMMIEEIHHRTANRSKAANLLGISPPTYRKLLVDMGIAP